MKGGWRQPADAAAVLIGAIVLFGGPRVLAWLGALAAAVTAAATAVPETLGGAGVTFSPKDLEHAAEMLGLLVYDDGLRADILEGQRRRLTDFTDARFDPYLDRLVAHFS
mgnify:CR=1 FL=1